MKTSNVVVVVFHFSTEIWTSQYAEFSQKPEAWDEHAVSTKKTNIQKQFYSSVYSWQ